MLLINHDKHTIPANTLNKFSLILELMFTTSLYEYDLLCSFKQHQLHFKIIINSNFVFIDFCMSQEIKLFSQNSFFFLALRNTAMQKQLQIKHVA